MIAIACAKKDGFYEKKKNNYCMWISNNISVSNYNSITST